MAGTAMALAAVVTTQIGNLFAQRSEIVSSFRFSLLNNKLIWLGIITELTLIAGIVYAPFLQKFIGTSSFPLVNWLFCSRGRLRYCSWMSFRKALVRARCAAPRGGKHEDYRSWLRQDGFWLWRGELTLQGHTVTVVDNDPQAFERLGAQFKGQTVVGVGFDRDILLKAGIERADGLAAVTPSDEANLVAARLAGQSFPRAQGGGPRL
jgi:hypothetical protein